MLDFLHLKNFILTNVPPITFPKPNKEQIQRFKKIIEAERGIILSDDEAAGQCRQFIQYFYLTNYLLPIAQKLEAHKKDSEQNLSK